MKKELRELLEERRLERIEELAARSRRVLGALLALSFDPDPRMAWRAVEATGVAAARIARDDPDAVREHLRRLLWLVSEESGGICWRAPEIMAEIVHHRPELFADYAPIVAHLLLEMAEEDLAHFRPGILWAIARLGPVAEDVAADVGAAVEDALAHADPQVRGLAVLCLARLGRSDALARHEELLRDGAGVELFEGGELRRTSVRALVEAALSGGPLAGGTPAR